MTDSAEHYSFRWATQNIVPPLLLNSVSWFTTLHIMSFLFKWLPREVIKKLRISSLSHYIHICMYINCKSPNDEVYDIECRGVFIPYNNNNNNNNRRERKKSKSRIFCWISCNYKEKYRHKISIFPDTETWPTATCSSFLIFSVTNAWFFENIKV